MSASLFWGLLNSLPFQPPSFDSRLTVGFESWSAEPVSGPGSGEAVRAVTSMDVRRMKIFILATGSALLCGVWVEL